MAGILGALPSRLLVGGRSVDVMRVYVRIFKPSINASLNYNLFELVTTYSAPHFLRNHSVLFVDCVKTLSYFWQLRVHRQLRPQPRGLGVELCRLGVR